MKNGLLRLESCSLYLRYLLAISSYKSSGQSEDASGHFSTQYLTMGSIYLLQYLTAGLGSTCCNVVKTAAAEYRVMNMYFNNEILNNKN